MFLKPFSNQKIVKTHMRELFKTLSFAAVLALAITSCKKEVKENNQSEVSEEILSQIKALGFSTDGAKKVEGGYLVEGDIILNDASLASNPTSPNMMVAKEEQYR